MRIKVTWEERFTYSTLLDVDQATAEGIISGEIEEEEVIQLVEAVNRGECESFETEILDVSEGEE